MLLVLSIAGLFLLPSPWNVIGVCVAALLEVGEIWVYRKYLSRFRVQGGAEGMVGERAEVIERCAPVGRAKVRGEIWAAQVAEGTALEAGSRARVTAVDGLTVAIAPEDSR